MLDVHSHAWGTCWTVNAGESRAQKPPDSNYHNRGTQKTHLGRLQLLHDSQQLPCKDGFTPQTLLHRCQCRLDLYAAQQK